MKKVVKALSLAIAGIMLVGSIGCNKTENDVAENNTTAQINSSSYTVQQGKLIWATNASFEPYEYVEGNEVVGIDAEIAEAIGAKLGLEVQVENMDFDAVIPSIVSGKVDIGLAGMTVNAERLKNVDFSTPYVDAGQAIIVKEGSSISSVADLEGKIVGVQRGTTGDEYVSSTENNVNVASVERFANVPDIAQSLLTDKIDAIVLDNEPAKKMVATNESLIKLDENLTSEEYAISIAKGNEELLNKINDALNEMKENGELQAILDKYLAE